jgi:glycosyltransferase involved in cell wall biosynthesis
MIDVSILVPAKNGARYITQCLDAVFSQDFDGSTEVIVVDSGSTDGTLDILKKYPVRLYQIPPAQFHHARTRNYLASLATGKYLVFLSQDAFPATSGWLRSLISNFDDPKIAAAYGRHLPKPGCTLERKVTLASAYGDRKIVKDISCKNELGYRCFHFSTVNAAIRRDVWEKIPFPEDMPVYEDVFIAVRLLNEGWKIAYEPTAAAYHSHNFDAKALFKRYFDTGVIYQRLKLFENGGGASMFQEGLRVIAKKVRPQESATAGDGERSRALQAVYYDFVKFVALSIGRNEHLLPLPAKRRLSAYKIFG